MANHPLEEIRDLVMGVRPEVTAFLDLALHPMTGRSYLDLSLEHQVVVDWSPRAQKPFGVSQIKNGEVAPFTSAADHRFGTPEATVALVLDLLE